MSFPALSQESKSDSISHKTENKVESKESKSHLKKNKKKKKEGFGETLVSLGKGFLDRLKYRFNLEAIEEKVGNTKQKFKNKEGKKRKD